MTLTSHSAFRFDTARATQASPPRRTTIRLFGIDILDASPEAAIAALLAPGRRRIAFLNAHCGNVMARDPAYAAALATADMVLPDGIGVELAARMA